VAKNRCSEDLPDSHRRIRLASLAGSCSCAGPSGRRTARRTTIGAWSRINVFMVAVWCSATCCTSVKSTPRRQRSGARPSRSSMMTPGSRKRWRCFPKITAPRSRPTLRSCSFDCPKCGSAGRGSGGRAGWPGSCGKSCSWIGSGQIVCREAAKARVGIRFCRCWPAIGSLRLAANGNCIANGLAARRWLTCWVRISDWPSHINSMSVMIFC
jgi:hypothetical protein